MRDHNRDMLTGIVSDLQYEIDRMFGFIDGLSGEEMNVLYGILKIADSSMGDALDEHEEL